MSTSKLFNARNAIILATTAAVIGLLVGGFYYPESFVMSFADVSLTHTIIRLVIATALIGILVSRPPRSAVTRVLLGFAAATIQVAAFKGMMEYQVNLLDAIVYLEVSIIFAIEALEYSKLPKQAKRIVVTSQ